MRHKPKRSRIRPSSPGDLTATPNVSVDNGEVTGQPSPDIFNVTDNNSECYEEKSAERRSIGGRVSKTTRSASRLGKLKIKNKLKIFTGWMSERKIEMESGSPSSSDARVSKPAPEEVNLDDTDIFKVSPLINHPDKTPSAESLLDRDIPPPLDPEATPKCSKSTSKSLRRVLMDVDGNVCKGKKTKSSKLKKTFTFRREKIKKDSKGNVNSAKKPKKTSAKSANSTIGDCSFDALDISALVHSPRRLAGTEASDGTNLNNTTLSYSKVLEETISEVSNDSAISSLSCSSFLTVRSVDKSKRSKENTPCYTPNFTPLHHHYLTRSATRALDNDVVDLKNVRINDDSFATPAQRRGASGMKRRIARHASLKALTNAHKVNKRCIQELLGDTSTVIGDTPGAGTLMRQDAGHTPRASRRKNRVEYDERLI